MRNPHAKIGLKNVLRVLGFLAFMFYVGTFSLGMARKCRGYPNEGGCSRLYRGVMGVPCPNCNEPSATLHDNILSAAYRQIGCDVDWVNRSRVTSLDGNTHNKVGISYGFSGDDVESFHRKMQERYYEDMWWSEYGCGPYPCTDVFRPGGRMYMEIDCRLLDGGRFLCSPEDEIPGTMECSWSWAGNKCSSFVDHALIEASGDRFQGLKILPEQDQLFDFLIEYRLGRELMSRDEAVPGDLVFYDMDSSTPGYDHVAVFSRKALTYDGDCSMGNLGLYSFPFYYRAHDEGNWLINEAYKAEWDPYFTMNKWGVFEYRTTYVHMLEIGE